MTPVATIVSIIYAIKVNTLLSAKWAHFSDPVTYYAMHIHV